MFTRTKFLFLVLAAAGIAAGPALGAISNSVHDFTVTGGFNEGGEICMPCHTPHNALSADGADAVPLWNHTVTTASFTPYASTTLNATVGTPSGVSKLCLSCHDGTVALDSFGGAGAPASGPITGDALVGADLSNDHPISFTYDAALVTADGGLNPITDSSGISGGTTIEADMLFSGSVECASCHDVHDDAGIPKLLRKSNAASALCLTCHNK